MGKRGAEQHAAPKKTASSAKGDAKFDAKAEAKVDTVTPPKRADAKPSGREEFQSKRPEAAQLETGDIVFIQSRSKQATALGAAMKGTYNHVGIVFVTSDGPQVIAAEDSLRQLPYDQFIRRHGATKIAFKRLTDDSKLTKESLRPMQIFSFTTRGSDYDFAFGWDDDKLYSSEYVHKAFAKIDGVELGRKETLMSLGVTDALAKKLGAKSGVEIDSKTEVVTPSSIFEDEDLETVWELRG